MSTASRREEDLVLVEGHTSVGLVEDDRAGGPWFSVAPQHHAGGCMDRQDLIVGRGDEHHTAIDDPCLGPASKRERSQKCLDGTRAQGASAEGTRGEGIAILEEGSAWRKG